MKNLTFLILSLSFNSYSQIITNAKPEQSDSAGKEIFMTVEEMPEPKGGLTKFYQYLSKNIVRPKLSKQKDFSCKVNLQFIVQADGSLTNVTVAQGHPNCKACEDEAIRVVSSYPHKWEPAKLKGRPVPVYYNLPISFK